MRDYVDDGIIIELQWWPDGCRCLRAVLSLASDPWANMVFPIRPSCQPRKILTGTRNSNYWYGSLILRRLRITGTLPSHRFLKLHKILKEWPSSRAYASAKQVSQLVGFLMHVPFAVRPGRLFVNRSLALVGMPRIAIGVATGGRPAP